MAEVVLVHGLWYRTWSMRVLASRLDARGFRLRHFDYPTRTGTLAANAAALGRFCRGPRPGELHFVGHSLGGLLILSMLQSAAGIPPGRVVLLGTPLQGSAVARRGARMPGGRFLLGSAAAMLAEGAGTWPVSHPVGMIAGDRPLGLGRLTGGLAGASDGTVALSETQHPGLAGHVVFPVTHTGMLFSAVVAEQTANFLKHGQFAHCP